jgi:HKD family nuclease
MAKVIYNLSEGLSSLLKTADEIWVAVALLNSDGLNFIQSPLKTTCKENYLLGIDLPTEPNALEKLFQQSFHSNRNIKIYSEKEHFHPKVYLIRTGKKLTAFVGSGNCTNGGLKTNIELSYLITDGKDCIQIKNWFENLYVKGKPLSTKFLKDYRIKYNKRIERKKENERLANEGKKLIVQDNALIFKNREELISVLKEYRKQRSYNQIRKSRIQEVVDLRAVLNYPNFAKPDIEMFFQSDALGHLINISKPVIIRNLRGFKRLLKMLCDENVSIVDRYNQAFSPAYKVEGVAMATISKILTIHDPEQYFVNNLRALNALKKYGIEFPRGLKPGEKYKITADVLKEICLKTKIENLAILDHFLHLEGKKGKP